MESNRDIVRDNARFTEGQDTLRACLSMDIHIFMTCDDKYKIFPFPSGREEDRRSQESACIYINLRDTMCSDTLFAYARKAQHVSLSLVMRALKMYSSSCSRSRMIVIDRNISLNVHGSRSMRDTPYLVPYFILMRRDNRDTKRIFEKKRKKREIKRARSAIPRFFTRIFIDSIIYERVYTYRSRVASLL